MHDVLPNLQTVLEQRRVTSGVQKIQAPAPLADDDSLDLRGMSAALLLDLDQAPQVKLGVSQPLYAPRQFPEVVSGVARVHPVLLESSIVVGRQVNQVATGLRVTSRNFRLSFEQLGSQE